MNPVRNNYTTLDFDEWRTAGKLVIAPKFQRRGVWSTPKRSFLIDTIVRELPVPPIYLRQRQSDDQSRTIREVIDGQQRISAVLDFVHEKFTLSKTLKGPHKGKRFSKLLPKTQNAIRDFSFNCETFQGIDDKDVLEIFARMNTYSVQLNQQELRNGKYFGKFKQTVYALALEHNTYWLNHKIFTNQGIARMKEAELVSELLIAQHAGQQDKKRNIEDYYESYDEDFPGERSQILRFRAVLDEVNQVFRDELKSLEWRRPPLFYTLFCVIFHRLYGLKNEKAPPQTKRRALKPEERTALFDAAVVLSEALAGAKDARRVGGRFGKFIAAAQRQTDNIGPRKDRFSALTKHAFG